MKRSGGEREQSKLAELLGKHGIRYRWFGLWPAIPVARKPLDFELPNAPPPWVDKIRERIFEIVLPLKKNMSLEFYDAAIFGYAFSAMSRERDGRMAASKKLPRGGHRKVQLAKAHAAGNDLSGIQEGDEREAQEGLAAMYEPAIKVCEQKRAEAQARMPSPEAADILKGFDYGIQCQRREKGWMPSSLTSKAGKLTCQTVRVYEALLRNWRTVALWTHQNKSAREMGEYIANYALTSSGETYAKYFNFLRERQSIRRNHPAYKGPHFDGPEIVEEEVIFQKTFQATCGRVGIPLPPRGRPPAKSA